MPSRQQHYIFAFRILPKVFHKDPRKFLMALNNGKEKLLRDIWDDVGTMVPPNERVNGNALRAEVRMEGQDTVIGLVTMPKPKDSPEAYFIALVYRNEPGGATSGYFTLERGIKGLNPVGTMICMVQADLSHSNLGYGIKPNLKGFYQEVVKLISE